jgi:acetyl esterase/lipase
LKTDKIHPEIRRTYKYIPPLPFHNRKFLFAINFLLEMRPKAKSDSEVRIEEKRLTNATIRIYKPCDKLSGAGLLWVHGGGLISGTAGANDPECSAYARDLKLVVVSVEYRLAPKYPFPAALDDCFETWQWMQQSADKLEINPSRIAISGQSSGGGLTASLAHRIFDEGGIQPAAQALFCPMLDDRTALRHELDIIQHCGTTKAIEPLGHGILVGLRVRSMSPLCCAGKT